MVGQRRLVLAGKAADGPARVGGGGGRKLAMARRGMPSPGKVRAGRRFDPGVTPEPDPPSVTITRDTAALHGRRGLGPCRLFASHEQDHTGRVRGPVSRHIVEGFQFVAQRACEMADRLVRIVL